MPSWTKEQQEAIFKEGSNIIVSAGAGSGKTAVLTERVIRKLKSGVPVDHLLVLTFTNEAANEMKERIRTAIKKEASLKEQLDLLDQAYITTFDSYSLSIVKKYHYLLGIEPSIKIIDASIIEILKNKLMDEIFLKKYEEGDADFLTLISAFCVKDDKAIKKAIITINQKLDLKYDKDAYLQNYLEEYFSESKVASFIKEYNALLQTKISFLNDLLDEIALKEDGVVYEEFLKVLTPLLNSKDYQTIKANLDIKLPRLKNGSAIKDLKEELKKNLTSLTKLVVYDDEEQLKELYLSTKPYIKAIISIIKELDLKITSFKKAKNSYEFTDIAKMAIKVVDENITVKEELKNYYQEIMVDEYQDTSDLQELFISAISNNNVYMVGDIKQSIYRFRNANPLIFKEKYEGYAKEVGGLKIDLLKNFRSRGEVLDDINLLFNKVMTSSIGGADYQVSHQMVFGNTTYDQEGKNDVSNHMEIYNYSIDDKTYSNALKEIFIIANDIKTKVSQSYPVFDRNLNALRPVTYQDFCIILDRGKEFAKYKKVFEYLKIPLTLYEDEKLTCEYDIMVLKNLIYLILKTDDLSFQNKSWQYCFMSVARSFLICYDDSKIYNLLHNKDLLQADDLYLKCKKIKDNLSYLTPVSLLDEIVKTFNYYETLIRAFDIESALVRLNYLSNIAISLTDLGYTNEMFYEYLDFMINESSNDIKYKINTKSSNSVKIMNIHKSKGLEFPICYFAGLYEKFNTSELKERFIFDNHYGIITPYFKEGIGELFTKELYKNNYYLEEISEKIRLFYVAVTRSKEKMIFVTSLDEQEKEKVKMVADYTKLQYRNFLDILTSIKDDLLDYVKDIDLTKIFMTKDYLKARKVNYQDFLESSKDKITFKNLVIPVDNNLQGKYSKSNNQLLSKNDKLKLLNGIKFHELFEKEDFLTTADPYVLKFLAHPEFTNYRNAQILKEYEFIFEEEEILHGIIDLMFVYPSYIQLIDYKLKNTSDAAYLKQLLGYQSYIEKITKKKVELYLYSIIDDKLVSVTKDLSLV